jgi:DNA-binding transcriptional MerR regulator
LKGMRMNMLPTIPNQRYFTIGEVSTLCAVKPHVLRYWEQEFQVLRPSKRRGNRRYYRLEDVNLVRQIKALLYEQGYTISGARMQISLGIAPLPTEAPAPLSRSQALIEQIEEVLSILA